MGRDGRIALVRTAIALATLLFLPACETGSGDDVEPDSGADVGTTEDPGSEGDPSGPGPTSSDPSTTTTPDPTADSSTTQGPTTGEDTTQGATADSGTTGGQGSPPPTNGAELLPWLEAGEYLEWTAESGVHASTGPHFGGVRTFVNDALLGSLQAGAPAHPEGAAAVKELYGAGDRVGGWSVMVKVQADSAGGDGWYWSEIYQGNVYGEGTGDPSCTGCHGAGNDYVLTPFPLQ
jgi:hypothetical protein